MSDAPIICGVDGSRASLAAARLGRALARRLRRRVDFVYVVTSADEACQREAATAVHAQLVEAVGVDVVLRMMPGPPAERLVAISRQSSLLVIGTRGTGALRQALLGSVSAVVTRSAAAPVIVVPPRAVDARRRLLARSGVICGVRDEHDVACAGTAAWLACELGLRLTLVHVVPHPRLPVAAGGVPSPGQVRSPADEMASASEMLEQIACAIAPSAPPVTRTRIVAGPVGPELERLSAADHADLVALGPSRHGAFAGALARSPGAHLMRHGNRLVMITPTPEAVLIEREPFSGRRRDAGRAARRES
jgi:nucleotide-binding universal stress UspA family protein